MDFLNKLLTKQVQVKELSEVDVQKVQRNMEKRGFHLTKEEIEEKIQEYAEDLEFCRNTRLKNIAFVSTLVALALLAIQDFGIILFSSFMETCFTILCFSFIAFSWLLCYLQIKKRWKLYYLCLIAGIVLEVGMIVLMIFGGNA